MKTPKEIIQILIQDDNCNTGIIPDTSTQHMVWEQMKSQKTFNDKL